MIRRTLSAQGLRPDFDPLEERKLLSTFEDFNSSRFNGPLPFQQAMPVVLRVDYAPPFESGDPRVMISWDKGTPEPRNIGSGPFHPDHGPGSFDPGQGMMPPPGPDHNPPFIPKMQALFDWVHGHAQADVTLSETLSSESSSVSPSGMNHSESLPPLGSTPGSMEYSANSATRSDFPGGPPSHGPGLTQSPDQSESINAGSRVVMSPVVVAYFSGRNSNLNGLAFGVEAAALAAAGREPNAAANMAKNGDPGVSHPMVGPSLASITPSMPLTALTMSPLFNDQALSVNPATSADLASSSLPRRNTSIHPDSENPTNRVTDGEILDQPSELEATVGVIAARGSELLSQFLPGDVTLLGNAVDKFLERLHGLGDSLPTPDHSAPARIQWPIAVTFGAVILEIGRRRFLKREDDDESAGSGFAPRSRLAGWPGSWTARVP